MIQQSTVLDGRRAASDIGSHLLWAALIAGLVSCGIPLLVGITGEWSPMRILLYMVVAVTYLALTQLTAIPKLEHLCLEHTAAYLAVQGILCGIMQTISGDGFIQPIAFTVPLVTAAFWYEARGTTIVGAAYLMLMAVGLWFSGRIAISAIVFAVASYGALMTFMYNATRMIVREAAARARADQLAADLAQERVYLERLTTINATLARDLDLTRVLEHIAEAGLALTQAGRVHIWLREGEPGEGRSLRLAMQIPVAQPFAIGDEAPTFSTSPSALPGAIIFPLFAKGHEIGVLELYQPTGNAFSSTDIGRLQPFADAAALAIENALLYERAHLSAILAERNRLARELHDTIAQGLTAVTMHLEAAQRSFERDPGRTRQRLSRAHELARSTLDDVRRSVWMLAAPLVDSASLDTALDQLTHDVSARTGLSVTYQTQGTLPPLDHAVTTQLVRIAQEALHNVEKHARAATVAVELASTTEGVRLTIRDDGVGFVPDAAIERRAARSNGFGLHSLRERARIAGGTIHIDSAPGQGASIHIFIPTIDHTETTRIV